MLNTKTIHGLMLQFLVIAFLVLIFSPMLLAGNLSGNEVRQLISGNTVEKVHAKRGYSIVTYYSPDGTYRQIADGEAQSGTWNIDSEGQLCSMRQDWGGECRLIAKEGSEWKAYKVPDNPMKPRTLKRIWKKIVRGNPRNL